MRANKGSMAKLRCHSDYSAFRYQLLFLFTLSSLEADQFCQQRFFQPIATGPSTNNIISEHSTYSLLECGGWCLQKEACYGFHYRQKIDNQANCQLVDISTNDNPHSSSTSDWKFYQPQNISVEKCSSSPCQNGGVCVANGCHEEEFSCICDLKYAGRFCEVERVFKSCKEVLSIYSGAQDGVYSIETNTTGGHTKLFCQLTSLEGCQGGGWTMVMKIDGSKSTFVYNSSYWADTQSWNLAGGLTAFDDQETKLPTYHSTSFNELCVGMKVGNDLNFLSINYVASSLHGLISDGQNRSTSIGRKKWKSLIEGSSLQYNCTKEGFNIRAGDSKYVRVRVGIIGNEQVNCVTSDSYIGFGGPIKNSCHCSSKCSTNAAGNFASCEADNGNQDIKAMGYIFIR